MTLTTIAQPTPEPTALPTVEATDVPTEVAAEATADTDVVEDNNTTEAQRPNRDLIRPLAVDWSLTVACDFTAGSDTTPFVLDVSPPIAGIVIEVTVTNIDGTTEVLPPVTITDPATELPFRTPDGHFRKVSYVVTYLGDDNPAAADVECDSTTQPTTVTTQLVDAAGADIPHHSQVNEGVGIGDTTLVNGATTDISGTVTYNVYKGLTCSGSPAHTEKVTIVDGDIPDAAPWVPDLGPGWYTWQVAYSGDDNNLPSIADCKVESVFDGTIQPELTTTMMHSDTGQPIPQNGEVPTGTTVSDTATLIPHPTDIDGANNLAGTITYTLVSYDPAAGTCSSDVISTSGPLPIVDGVIPPAPGVKVTAKGSYAWIATYSGDAFNKPASSPCGEELFAIGNVVPDMATVMFDADTGAEVSPGGNVFVGSSMFDTTVFTGNETPLDGEITYELYAGSSCSGAPAATFGPFEMVDGQPIPGSNADGDVFTFDAAGTYNWVVRYSGNDLNAPSQSFCGSETVNVVKFEPEVATAPFHANGEEIPKNGVISLDDGPVSFGDVAMLDGASENPAPTGTVTFKLYRGYLCSGAAMFSVTVPIDPATGTATIPPDALAEIGTAGTFNWGATYSGDAANEGGSSPCGEEQFHVTGEGSGGGFISTLVHDEDGAAVQDGDTIEYGVDVYDTADLRGSFETMDGELTYNVYWSIDGEGACTTDLMGSFTVPVVDGVAGDSRDGGGLFTPPHAGVYQWQVVFTNDAGNVFTSPCGLETFYVEKPETETTTVMHRADGSVLPHAGRVIVGSPQVYDTATVTGLDTENPPTGTFTFRLYRTINCSDTPTVFTPVEVANGVPTESELVTISEVGVYNWVVEYSGDEFNLPSASSCGQETFYAVLQPSITTQVMQGVNQVPSPDGEVNTGTLVYDTATLSNFNPGARGTVTYRLYNNATCSGSPIFAPVVTVTDGVVPNSPSYRVRFAGTYSWVAVYSGDVGGTPTGLTNGVIGECGDEEFTVVNAATPGILTNMERVDDLGQWVDIKQSEFVNIPLTVRDNTVISGVPNTATGTVTYALYRSATCTPASLVSTVTLPFTDGTPPTSPNVDITANGTYHWLVTVNIAGSATPLVSRCGQETFVALENFVRSANITCSYFASDRTSTFVVNVSRLQADAPDVDPPRPATPDEDAYAGLRVTYQAYDQYLNPVESGVYNNYVSNVGMPQPDFVRNS